MTTDGAMDFTDHWVLEYNVTVPRTPANQPAIAQELIGNRRGFRRFFDQKLSDPSPFFELDRTLGNKVLNDLGDQLTEGLLGMGHSNNGDRRLTKFAVERCHFWQGRSWLLGSIGIVDYGIEFMGRSLFKGSPVSESLYPLFQGGGNFF